ATGTIRRHPDVPWIRTETDLPPLIDLQRALLANAASLVKPGGLLVYSTCSLEPEENEEMIVDFLSHHPDFHLRPIAADELAGCAELLNKDGNLRTLPSHFPDSDPRQAGIDGFFAARMQKKG